MEDVSIAHEGRVYCQRWRTRRRHIKAVVMRKQVSNVIVLGGGSAGFLAAIALRTRLPALPVTVVRSKEIGIIGVGEGSTVGLTHFLHRSMNVPVRQFFEV